MNSSKKNLCQQPKILIYTGLYLPGFKGGGPIKSIANLSKSISDEFNIFIITSDRDLGETESYKGVKIGKWNKSKNGHVFYTSHTTINKLLTLKYLFSSKFSIIYFNSLFSLYYSIFPLLLARILKKTIILAPRGELSPEALSIKKFKKKIYLKFFNLLKNQNNITFHASSNYEAADIKNAFGSDIDVFIAENIGSFESPATIPDKSPNELRLVSISRISPIKNLKQALIILSKINLSISYDVYGPIEDTNYWRECLEIISNLPKNISVRYNGEILPDNVIGCLSQYDMFFLPTKGENYGHAIAEAFCAGLPVLISDATPWRHLQDKGIGWDYSLNSNNLFRQAIEFAAKIPTDKYRQFRSEILVWAHNKFSNSQSIEINKKLFRHSLEKNNYAKKLS